MKYYKQVDTLKGLSIIAVIFYHDSRINLQGGFLGVDVFFVIAGFLVGNSFCQPKHHNLSFIFKYYRRRLLRILPPQLFALFLILPVCILTYKPYTLTIISEAICSCLVGLSNYFFWRQSGYFSLNKEDEPLIHFWSLSCEEQFFFTFPLLLVLAKKFFGCYNKCIYIIILISFASCILFSFYKQNFNFYSISSRYWQFMIGVLISINHHKFLQKHQKVFGFISFVGLISCFCLINGKTSSPGLITTVPVFFTVVYLISNTEKYDKNGNTILSILQYLGKRSFSLYLYHQPCFCLFETFFGNSEVFPSMIFVYGSIFILSKFSYDNLEAFHRVAQFRRTYVLISCLGVWITLLTCSCLLIKRNGYFNPHFDLAPNVEYSSLAEKLKIEGQPWEKGHPDKVFENLKKHKLTEFSSNQNIILYGDSHAQALAYSLKEQCSNFRFNSEFIQMKGVTAVPGIVSESASVDRTFKKSFAQFLEYCGSKNSTVIISIRWTYRIYPVDGYKISMPYVDEHFNVEPQRSAFYYGVDKDKPSTDPHAKERIIIDFVSKLSNNCRNLFIVYPIPESAYDIEAENRVYYNSERKLLKELYLSKKSYLERNRFMLKTLGKINKTQNIYHVKMDGLLIEQDKTYFQKNFVPFYYDDDHLSKKGADIIIEKIFHTAFNEN